jgi:hypothetical protein
MTDQRMLRLRATVSAVGAGVLVSAVSVGAQQAAVPGKRTDVASDLRQGFSVVLLLGDAQGVDSQDALPSGARKALLDVKDFLPYKGYRLIDTHWMLCCSGSTPAITRVRGLDDRHRR